MHLHFPPDTMTDVKNNFKGLMLEFFNDFIDIFLCFCEHFAIVRFL